MIRKIGEGVTVYTGKDMPYSKGIMKRLQSVIEMDASHAEQAVLYLLQLKPDLYGEVGSEDIKKKFIKNYNFDLDTEEEEWAEQEFNNGRIVTVYFSE